jgi:cobyrinic acid a,c-diamide synthase
VGGLWLKTVGSMLLGKTMQQAYNSAPRLVVAGLCGDSGKTLVSLGLLLLAKQQGIPAAGFKKGPDYIDAAWLGWASGRPARNLDTYLMGNERVARSFSAHTLAEGINVIEGNRGLYDGFDARGTHSTGELAKLLRAPVLFVLDATKITHTAAALVLGCQKLDPEVQISGVILNRVSGKRHEAILRESIESTCHVPVVGVLPKSDGEALLPGRHLGLVTPEDHPLLQKVREGLLALLGGRIDFNRVLAISSAACSLELPAVTERKTVPGKPLRIGYLKDSAFSFYYPENLEALEAAGAYLVPVSALSSGALPDDLDGLYMGGGFPETHGEAISANQSFLASVRSMAASGLPIYAECGGLMFLAQAIQWQGKRFPMAGVFPFEVEVCESPQGHGYTELLVDTPNGYFTVGKRLRGHEFHYSRIVARSALPRAACEVKRGGGCYGGRDGITLENVWATYTHIHAVATPEWATGFVRMARRHSDAKGTRASR